MKKLLTILLLLPCLLISLQAQDKGDDKKDKKEKEEKKYEDVITDKAVSSQGLFGTHEVEGKHFFEIPDTILEQEILIVSRISGFVKGLNFGGAGVKSRPQQVIRWQKKGKKILLRAVSYNSVASFEDPIYNSVKNNNFEPIIEIFDIEVRGDSSSVINIKALFDSDIPMIGAVGERQRKSFGIKSLDKSRSFINSMKSFPNNVEVKHVLTYKGGNDLPDNQITGTLSVEMNQSFIVLPKEPMQPRYYDARVGYFSLQQTDYSMDAQRAATKRFITRWRLEPKDPVAYANGELVEPIKPIVYYIDPATPEKWRPFIKAGVNDWQSAFEKVGFKNAIYAADAPSKEENPDWSPEDTRYSVIRYVSTDIQNAMGPHVHDPRTGEILESDIIWYHNVMRLLRNWYFIQTAAINPKARKVKFDTEVMGRLIRFVAAHEVGHTLGLPHNMGSSVAYPVDSLRSVSFTKKMGTSPSIMDYARFNYVAQPEDGDVGLMPNVGPYDDWAIHYGYKPIPEASTAESERPILNEWVKEKADDPIFRYGRQRGLPLDPSAQTEDLGDDSMKASEYGISNLKRILPNIKEWTSEDGEDYEQLEEVYGQIVNQYRRYMGHVIANIGGVVEISKTADQDDVMYRHTSKAKQKRAISFLSKHLFNTPTWLVENDIVRRFEPSGTMQRMKDLQSRSLNILFNTDRMNRLIENEALIGNQAYGLADLFDDTKKSIFSNNKAAALNPYTRNIQRVYIEKLESLVMSDDDKISQTDITAFARATLKSIADNIKVSKKLNGSAEMHQYDIKRRIEKALDIED